MSITKQQAMTANEFHCGDCTRHVGPRGGVTIQSEVWRRNGATKTWKTRPNDFAVPVKHGLRDYFTVTQYAEGWHVAADCPLNDLDEEDQKRNPNQLRVGSMTQERSVKLMDRLFTLPR